MTSAASNFKNARDLQPDVFKVAADGQQIKEQAERPRLTLDL